MSDNPRMQRALQDLDDWTDSNRGQVILFLLLACLVLYGIFVLVRDAI